MFLKHGVSKDSAKDDELCAKIINKSKARDLAAIVRHMTRTQSMHACTGTHIPPCIPTCSPACQLEYMDRWRDRRTDRWVHACMHRCAQVACMHACTRTLACTHTSHPVPSRPVPSHRIASHLRHQVHVHVYMHVRVRCMHASTHPRIASHRIA